MKQVFRLYRRNGIFYSHDSRTGKQESLKTRDKGTAQRLLNAKNEAAHNPAAVNLQIARNYVVAGHPEMLTRTWRTVHQAMTPLKDGDTRERWERVGKDAAYEALWDILLGCKPHGCSTLAHRPVDSLGKCGYFACMLLDREGAAKQPLLTIVDDDVSFRNSLRRLIQAFGFRVAAFGSGRDFLSSSQVADTACLVLDMRMPDMSGLELQRFLAEAGRRIPIIFITGFANEDEEQRAMRAGAVAFLHKPINDRTLLQCVKTALSQGSDATETPGDFTPSELP